MNGLQKKCIMASVAFHTLLLALLLFGSALMPAPKSALFKPIQVYSADKISDMLSSGGEPNVPVAPAVLTPSPAPQPQVAPTKPLPQAPPPYPVERVAKPISEPPKIERHVETPKPEKMRPEKITKLPNDDLVEKPRPPHKIEIDPASLKFVHRKPNEKADDEQAAAAATAAAASKARAQRRLAAQQFASAYRTISKNISSSTLVELTPGVGGPGEVSVNYRDLIASKYYNAWSAPTDLDDTTPVVNASVTIDHDGNVKSARIVTPSGNRSMDRSIQNVLETVTFFEPFPASSKESEKTFTIRFNLQAKRATG